MGGVLHELPAAASVAIIRLRSLGDCVLTTPAVALLKKHRPDLRISVVVEDRFTDVFRPHPDVTSVLPPSPGLLRKLEPVLTLNLHGGTRSIALTAASGARYRAGFAHHRGAAVYNIRIPRAQEILGVDRKVHTAEHLASALFYLGVPQQDVPRAHLTAGPADPAPYAVIHPVAATPSKTWPASRFVAVARHLRDEHDLDPIFVAGPGEDLSPFTEFRTIPGAPLADTKSLLAGAQMFVGNDSGPAHIAAAFGVRSVVLFGPSDADIWAPWRVESCVFRGAEGRIDAIAESDVIDALDSLRVAQ